VLPDSALTGAAPVEVRQPSSEGSVEEPDMTARTRETQNMLFGMANYRKINCSNCGTPLRLPPNFNAPSVRCPHCGTVNELQ
jgi:heat shock protein HtpX